MWLVLQPVEHVNSAALALDVEYVWRFKPRASLKGRSRPEILLGDSSSALMLCFDSTLISLDEALGNGLNEGQVVVVVWLSMGCLSYNGTCRTPHGISVGLYPLLSLLRNMACSLTCSAGSRWCGPCVLRWAALRNLSLCGLPSCLSVHICVFALLRTMAHLCVSVHNKRSLSVHGGCTCW